MTTFSTRAITIKRVVEFLDVADDADLEIFESSLDGIPRNPGERDISDILFQWVAAVRLRTGELSDGARMKLVDGNPRTPDPNLVFQGATSAELQDLIEIFKEAKQDRSSPPTADSERGDLQALDVFYSHMLAASLDDIVRRAYLLRKIEVAERPHSSVAQVFEEASRAYVLGLNIACVALCRSSLEKALKDNIRASEYAPDLIDVADGTLLEHGLAEWAREVFRIGNAVMHKPREFPTGQKGEEQALDLLIKARAVVQELYS